MSSINPIIPGFAPDPSIVLIDDTFFLVNSSFHLFPGLPIYASPDLVSWRQIGNVINRRAQLSLSKAPTGIYALSQHGDVLVGTGGLYAPTIRYRDGTIYVDGSMEPSSENFIVSTQDIWSDNWSDPVCFDFRGIDPSIFFDDDGRSFIQASGNPPGPMTKIHLFEIDLNTGQKLSEERMVWDGTGGVNPEGPHLYKKDGWYYLVIAEGGTHSGHMVTVARSRAVFGPYEAFEGNPILTARGTDEYIQFTGHCEMFQDRAGNWWGVCLGVRKDRAGRFIMGRESFITPAKWPTGGWPSLELVKSNPEGLARPSYQTTALTAKPMVDFVYIRDANLDDYEISNGGRDIALTARGRVDLQSPSESPTFIGKRQRHLDGISSVVMTCPSASDDVKAGLAVYKDEHRYARIFYDNDIRGETTAVKFEVQNNAQKIHRTMTHVIEPRDRLAFRLTYTEQQYQFSYRVPETRSSVAGWISIATVDTLDLTDLDFVGPVIGIFAVGARDETTTVRFSDLEIN
ncbi:hypothetical protein AYO22_05416 [Fonsecaea multimorphosa]|nr:hypothetical protein AYO22_05416 [Fonsecaea multimorphosa]